MHATTTVPGVLLAALAACGLAISAASTGLAADAAVKPAVKRHAHHDRHVSRAVRDYDGTAIVLRRTEDGLSEAIPVPRTNPRYYLNGEPVRVGARIVVE
jgi:hypothetical protein